MEKGNYGIRLCVYTVLAFLFAYLGSTTLLFLVAGVVLIGEKNEWAFRQVVQAIVLCYIGTLISRFFGLFSFVYSIPYIGSAWSTVVNLINDLVDLAVLVFAIIAVVRNLKGKDANLPLAKNVADWVYGIVTPKKVKVAPAPAAGTAFCTKCGAPVNGQFCTTCGTPVGSAENAQQ